MKLPVYLDHHSTTPLDPRVLEAMQPFLKENFANAASAQHVLGKEVEKCVAHARESVAALIGARRDEIIFTSGTTESNNQVFWSAREIYAKKGKHIISQQTEHRSVLEPLKALEKEGFRVTYLPVNVKGEINLKDLEQAVTNETILISLMHANNEIGTVHPIEAIGKIAKSKQVLFHVDAAQTSGKLRIDVEQMGIDLLSFSAHKMYGPKGVGALYIRRKNPHVRVAPLILGGGHENGLRSGTLNVPGIIGFGKTCELAALETDQDFKHTQVLRNHLQHRLTHELDLVFVHGAAKERLPHNLSVSFSCTESDALMMAVQDKLAVSSGSACVSGTTHVSHVLKALNLEGDLAQTTIRFGIGKFNKLEEIDFAADQIIEAVKNLRAMSPIYQDMKAKGIG